MKGDIKIWVEDFNLICPACGELSYTGDDGRLGAGVSKFPVMCRKCRAEFIVVVDIELKEVK